MSIKIATLIAATLIATSLYNLSTVEEEVTSQQLTQTDIITKLSKAVSLSPTQLSNAKILVTECQKLFTETDKMAYVLSTAIGECNLVPKTEVKANESTPLWRNTQIKYWASNYMGRGYVQITSKDNYQRFSGYIGVDILSNPELANRADVSAKIACYGMINGKFTGVGLKTYFSGGKQDWVNARRIINGTDKAAEFAARAQKIYNA